MCLKADIEATRKFSRNAKADKDGYIKMYKLLRKKDDGLFGFYQGCFKYEIGLNSPKNPHYANKKTRKKVLLDGYGRFTSGVLHVCLTESQCKAKIQAKDNINECAIVPVYVKKKDVLAIGKQDGKGNSEDAAVTELLIKPEDYKAATTPADPTEWVTIEYARKHRGTYKTSKDSSFYIITCDNHRDGYATLWVEADTNLVEALDNSWKENEKVLKLSDKPLVKLDLESQ